jgi:hypothetical protein
MHGAVAGVGVDDGMEEAVEGSPELHGFGRGLFSDGGIGLAPSIIVNEPVPAASLRDAANGAQPEAW